MKKRILALALAGTTAFSVFGAAISANAATSTDVEYQVDAYVSYEPVATTIYATTTGEKTTTTYFLKDDKGQLTLIGSKGSAADLKEHLNSRENVEENWTEYAYVATTTSGSGTTLYADDKNVLVINNDGTFREVTAIDDYKDADYKSFGIEAIDGTDGYKYNGTAYDSLNAAIDAAKNKNSKKKPAYLFDYDKNTVGVGLKFDYDTQAAYQKENIKAVTDTTPGGKNSKVVVNFKNPDKDSSNYTEWTFNSTMSDSTSVYPFEVKTETKYDAENEKWYLDVTKEADNTVYAYDFLPVNNTVDNASTIGSNWNADNKEAETAASLLPYGQNGGEATLSAEEGRGRAGIGIRYDVVTNWESFLSELSIAKGGYYYTIDKYSEFESMYKDMFYSDPVFDKNTGALVDYKDVDLYNIKGLLKDIWALRDQADYYAANTSEMVYLMQQYDKYIGEYIEQEEVSTDEWGDLLVDLLNSATADDFKTALDYNRYVAEVSRLTADYENALTAAQINSAEANMYNLLVNNRTTGSYMFYTSGVEKTALVDTMEGLYFNVGTLPAQYSVNPSTPTKVASAVDYTNYNYYVATPEFDGNVFTGFTTTLTTGYYSLYPEADYRQNGNTAYQFAGNNVDGSTYGVSVTDEYEWFLNVYELAANMNKYSKFQGQVDAVNEALNSAVAELAVVTAPSNVDTGALADAIAKYEGKIESDYNEGYYAKYTQANEYAEVAEGKWQTRIAAMITGVAGEALTFQGTQTTITKNDMKTVETAIKNGKTALEAIKENADYNAAQVNALNKAIADAQYIVDVYEGTYSRLADLQSVNHVYSYLVGDKDQIVKSDLTKAIEAIDAAINYSEIVMGWSQNENDAWMYGTEEGYLANGWNKIGSTWYYFKEDGTAMQNEWLQENGKWYWLNSNCGAAYGWAKVDGKWYYFNGDNSMRTGWVKVEGNWYYLNAGGAMVTGWCQIDGKWYYFSKKENALGQMEYNTTVDGYKLDANGVWVK